MPLVPRLPFFLNRPPSMAIKTAVTVAYLTEGEALEIANQVVEGARVVACVIVAQGHPAKEPVCYIVVPTQRPLVRS
jgi:hypothetical protein